MEDRLRVEDILDLLIKKEISIEKTRELLANEGVGNVDLEIDSYLSASRLLERYAVLEQVRSVHQSFVSNSGRLKIENNRIEQAKTIPMNPWIWRIAASVLMVFGLSFAYLYMTSTINNSYDSLFQPYYTNVSRGEENSDSQELVKKFSENDYSSVVNIFTENEETTNRERFLTAYSYIELEQYEEAIGLMNKIMEINKENKTNSYKDEAEFYSGLANLKLNKTEESKKIFKAIQQEPNHTFHDRIGSIEMLRLSLIR